MSVILPAFLAAAAVLLAWPAPSSGQRARPLITPVVVVSVPVAAIAMPRSWWPAGAVLGLSLVAGWQLARRARRRREAEGVSASVVAFCDEVAVELSAGTSPGRALALCAESWPVLEPVSRADRLGSSVPEALRARSSLPGAGDLQVVAGAWQVAEHTGARLADSVAAVADALRRRQATRRLVRSELASVRATARLMAGLPVLTLAVGGGLGGDPLAFLLTTTPGLVCLALGTTLALAGLAWIEAIAAAVERGAA